MSIIEKLGITTGSREEVFMQFAASEMLEILIEVMDCAEYWSEYDVPIGIHDRIKSAIEHATGCTWEEIKELIE